MAHLEEKIAEIADRSLREIIDKEVKKLKEKKQFGLVFEGHQPEVVPVPKAAVHKGAVVAKRGGNLAETWQVVRIHDGAADIKRDADDNRETVRLASLVVVRRMGEPVFPALVPLNSVQNTDPGEPHHILIEAENYHALQLLDYLYAGKVDCIYIDPPYNTGARDWKYNNDYVDSNDGWRHSKWLAFMEKRLKLAKRLLNPKSSVLIVTIDENEVNNLSLVLADLFSDAKRQTVTSVINPRGVYKDGCFARCDEYLLFVMIGDARVAGEADTKFLEGAEISWRTLRRSDLTSARGTPKGGTRQFYPIYVNDTARKIEEIGEPLPHEFSRLSVPLREGCTAVFPIRPDGTEMNWGLTPESLSELLKKGYVKLGAYKPTEPQKYVISYLTSGRVADVASGKATVFGKSSCGAVIAKYLVGKDRMPVTCWSRPTHNAETFGSNLLRDILGDQRFPFPKSLYAVADCVRFFTKHNMNALIVDFFGGSDTTANAVMLLNEEDSGSRCCMLVTNNEVSAEDAEAMRGQGLQAGEAEWEARGICRSVTWPRSRFSILGLRDDGTPLPGDYLTGRTITRDKPRTIRQLGFAEGRHLTLPQRKQLAAIMRAVPQSKLDTGPWFLDDETPVCVLWDVQKAEDWLDALAEADHVTDLYVVTTETRLFNEIKAQIQDTLGPIGITEEEKRPMAAGFAANLAYFKLEFLEPIEVAMGRQFAAILPVLWMMAGAQGPRLEAPDPHSHWLIPVACPFAVLLRETRFREFLAKIETRADLTHIFLVTNSESAFHDMHAALPDGLTAIQLYKNYLDNFKINTPRR